MRISDWSSDVCSSDLTADEFANIIVRTDPTGAITRLHDVARVELGAEDYGVNAYLSGRDSIIMGVTQRPGSNALAAAEGVQAQLAAAAKTFPKGLEYRIIWNPTEFHSEPMTAAPQTLQLGKAQRREKR